MLASPAAWKCLKAIKIGVQKALNSKHVGSLVSDVNLTVTSYFLSTKHRFLHFAPWRRVTRFLREQDSSASSVFVWLCVRVCVCGRACVCVWIELWLRAISLTSLSPIHHNLTMKIEFMDNMLLERVCENVCTHHSTCTSPWKYTEVKLQHRYIKKKERLIFIWERLQSVI